MGVWQVKKYKLELWQIADLLAPALILGQAIGRIGCDVFGIPMAKPYFWGVEVNGTLVHPAQVYELTLDYLLFAWLWIKKNSKHYSGQIFVHYLIGFSVIRSVVEFFRFNPEIFGFLSVSHLLNIATVIAALVLQRYLKKYYSPVKVNQEPSSTGTTILITVFLIAASVSLYYFIQG